QPQQPQQPYYGQPQYNYPQPHYPGTFPGYQPPQPSRYPRGRGMIIAGSILGGAGLFLTALGIGWLVDNNRTGGENDTYLVLGVTGTTFGALGAAMGIALLGIGLGRYAKYRRMSLRHGGLTLRF
ncbi:MAG: hypothetical protein KC636_13455, partial [Myxococcales bacterium]|nr:hypothetical protein [Myxococcales bacterium]